MISDKRILNKPAKKSIGKRRNNVPNYAALFSSSKTILQPQLLINAVESAENLLRFSRPRCPRLGCALRWNPHERSWDCPCHGSRFPARGELLDNPATKDLRPDP